MRSSKQTLKRTALTSMTFALLLSGCGGDSSSTSNTEVPLQPQPEAFTLNFKALSGQNEINCDTQYDGFGAGGEYSLGVSDLRFYVSNIQFFDSEGNALALTLDETEFQHNHTSGFVGLIDFLGTDSGYCELAAEGTPRTNAVITGELQQATSTQVASISFDIGVPQAVMKNVIAASADVSDAPSPLGEMHWSWASGYRHFVLNFVAMDAANTEMVENSNFHIGSTDCGSGAQALSEQDECGKVNTAQVQLDNFDLSSHSVTVNLHSIMTNVLEEHFVAPVWNPIVDGDESACIDEQRFNGYCITGESFGLQCHSGSTQNACVGLFPNFGLSIEDGKASATTNLVFGME
ncbi:MAG: MbnP family copper-binding protein [Pseudomonadota bacterium]